MSFYAPFNSCWFAMWYQIPSFHAHEKHRIHAGLCEFFSYFVLSFTNQGINVWLFISSCMQHFEVNTKFVDIGDQVVWWETNNALLEKGLHNNSLQQHSQNHELYIKLKLHLILLESLILFTQALPCLFLLTDIFYLLRPFVIQVNWILDTSYGQF